MVAVQQDSMSAAAASAGKHVATIAPFFTF